MDSIPRGRFRLCQVVIVMFICIFIPFVFMIPFAAATSFLTTCIPSPETCTFKQTQRGRYADCSDRGLTVTPCDLPEDVASLSMDANNFTFLDRRSFAGVPNLKVLSLMTNFIRYIDEDAFSGVPALENIVLSQNELASLPDTVFLKNHNLLKIILSFNKFRSLPTGALNSFKHERIVFLDNNLIEEVNFKGISSTNISKLILHRNKISRVDASDFFPLSTSHIGTFEMSYNNLKVLNDSVFHHLRLVRQLVLTHNSLSIFNLTSINGMASLDTLYLISCQIKSIRGFANVSSNKSDIIPPLRELRLSQNKIETVPPKVFVGLDQLIFLDLTGSLIRSLHSDSFRGLTNLQYLNLSQNLLHDVQAEVFRHLQNLKTLRLSKNKFTVLRPSQFRGIDPLEVLDLSHNQISVFDISVQWNTPSLEMLDITFNLLTSLQNGCFQGLDNLQILKLSSNPIAEWGASTLAGLGNLTNLVMLNLRRLAVFQDPFRGAGNLLRLDMSHNSLQGLAKIFLNLPSLVVLKLKDLKIRKESFRTRTPVFSSLSNLTTLDISENALDDMLPGSFDGLYGLKVLHLHKCEITTLQAGVFRNLSSLKLLNLANNNIQLFTSEHLSLLPSLKNLMLANNQLRGVLDPDLFTYNEKLRILTLANNIITGFKENTFLTITALDVSGNPLACTCDLVWFRHHLDEGNVTLNNPHKTNCSAKSIQQFVGKPVLEFVPDHYCGPFIIAYIFGSLLAVSLIALMVVAYRHRWWLNYVLFHVKLLVIGYDELQDGRGPLDYVYDINVIFPDDDEEWARMVFVAAFEDHLPDFPRDRVVCGEDDLPLGGTRLDAIDYVIENSFKIIVIVSNAAVNDAHFMTQLQMAVEHMNEVQLEKVILVFREEAPDDQLPYLARLFLSRNKPYFEWTEDNYGNRLFWEKLARNLRYNKIMNSIIPL